MVARFVAHAAKVAEYGGWNGGVAVTNGVTEVLHLSLPWGSSCEVQLCKETRFFNTSLLLQGGMGGRLMINITSHVNVLLAHGHDAIAVIVVRDDDMAHVDPPPP